MTYQGSKLDDNDSTTGAFTKRPTVSTPATKNSKAGEYSITVKGGTAPNYEITYVKGVLTVTNNNVSIDNPQADGIKIYSVDGKLYIQENTLNKDIYVFNTMGVLIKSSTERDIEISGLNVNSVYIVKTGNAAATVIIR